MNPIQTPTRNSLFTPKLATIVKNNSLNSRKLGCVLLTAFSKPTTKTRYLVSLVLESTCRYLSGETFPLLDERQLREIIHFSDAVMALASRVEVDLRDAKWTGDATEDVHMMYMQITIKLTSFLLDNSSGDSQIMMDTLQSSLRSARTFLCTTDADQLWAYVGSASERCGIWYPHGTKIVGQEEPTRYEKMVSKLSSGLKYVRKGKGRGKEMGKQIESTRVGCGRSGASVDGVESDSGVSVGEIVSEDESGGGDEGAGGVVGVAL
ncbi:hypothetical protein CTheo_5706 [Ceratobasidium theobromae]|uniref:Uncharacterized protein n=1 Tax=Ceratobasidium theobromae TaxID=1582974 RepID=A0A5N5QH49_9AGAM|nr:hypothetical protein CTheo_5706 [Ceratobasidium theobromae]